MSHDGGSGTCERAAGARGSCESTRVPKHAQSASAAARNEVNVAPSATLVDGVLLSRDTLSDLVKALDLLATFAVEKGAQLPARLTKLRVELADCATRVITRDASRTVTAALEFGHAELGLVDTATAAELLEISEDGVRDLCRRRRLAAMQITAR
ncbi:MAG: hypothetical protein QOI66_3518, partial [Myxococcales bacterium]|nr:hypothetical protein [Myxococcales bacterium]